MLLSMLAMQQRQQTQTATTTQTNSSSSWNEALVLSELCRYQTSAKRPRLESTLDALCLSELQIMDALEKVSYSEAADFLNHVAKLCAPITVGRFFFSSLFFLV